MMRINDFAKHPSRIFLLDGLGALLSASFLLAIRFLGADHFAMPATTVVALALVAFAFAAYSLSMAGFRPKSWRLCLRIIAAANSAYAILTATRILIHRNMLTTWDFAYFIGEILVLVALVLLEAKVVRARP